MSLWIAHIEEATWCLAVCLSGRIRVDPIAGRSRGICSAGIGDWTVDNEVAYDEL